MTRGFGFFIIFHPSPLTSRKTVTDVRGGYLFIYCLLRIRRNIVIAPHNNFTITIKLNYVYT